MTQRLKKVDGLGMGGRGVTSEGALIPPRRTHWTYPAGGAGLSARSILTGVEIRCATTRTSKRSIQNWYIYMPCGEVGVKGEINYLRTYGIVNRQVRI